MAPISQHRSELCLSLRDTLAWAREMVAPGSESAPLPLSHLADMRRIAPRTLREHLARLEGLGLLTRVYAGQAGLSIRVSPAEPDSDPVSGPAGERVPPTESDAQRHSVNAQILDSVDLLTRAGVYPQLARSLARKPWITPDLIAAWVHELRHIEAVRVLAAVLVRTLQDPERCLPPPATVGWRSIAARQSNASGGHAGGALEPERGDYAAQVADGQGGRLDQPESSDQRYAVTAAADHAVEARERVFLNLAFEPTHEPTQGLGELWARVHGVLAERLPPDADRLWLRRARPQCLSDGVLIVAVPTALGAEWLNLAGAPRCYDAICEAAGRRLLLRFVAAGARDCL